MDPITNPFAPGAGTRPPELAGRDELRQWWAGIVEAIPDVTTSVEQLVSGDDHVGVFRVVEGTISRDLPAFGIKGTGKKVAFRVADIFAVRNNKITAHWEIADTGPLVQMAASQTK